MAPKRDNADVVPPHVPVLAHKAVELLACSPAKVVVDATIGGGGHSELILRQLGDTGRLVGIDCDQRAIELARQRLGFYPNVSLIRENFRNLAAIVQHLGLAGIDALLLDLGLSSFQIDETQRGFSFKAEGPLDMRMDTRLELTAADIVNSYSEADIADILKKFGEEPDARRIARAVVRERAKEPILTTTQLARIVQRCVSRRSPRARIDPATRTFQALRIAVNSELENLKKVLDDTIPLLKPNGRICVISFHSLEDRIVKRKFVAAARGCTCPPEFPQCVCGRKPILKILTRKPITPSSEEVSANPRARSARLRAAQKLPQETAC